MPTVTACLVAETIRAESGGKFSVLGLYGVLPYVNIVFNSFEDPVSLALLMYFEPVSVQTRLELTLELPKLIPAKGEVNVVLPEDRVGVVAANFPLLKVNGPGDYEVVVRDKGG